MKNVLQDMFENMKLAPVLPTCPPPFFDSPKCPDFSEGQAPTHKQARPLKADSQCHKLAVALLHGSLTSMKAISITGGSEAPRRLRELRTMLKTHGVELIEEWVEGKARFKRYTIAFADLERFKELIGIKD